jgi:hypothetical protein
MKWISSVKLLSLSSTAARAECCLDTHKESRRVHVNQPIHLALTRTPERLKMYVYMHVLYVCMYNVNIDDPNQHSPSESSQPVSPSFYPGFYSGILDVLPELFLQNKIKLI